MYDIDHLTISRVSLCPISPSHTEPFLAAVHDSTVRDSLVAYNSSSLQRIAVQGSAVQHGQHIKVQRAASCEVE